MNYGNETPRNGDFASYVEDIIRHGSDAAAVSRHLSNPAERKCPPGRQQAAAHSHTATAASRSTSVQRNIMGNIALIGLLGMIVCFVEFDGINDFEIALTFSAAGLCLFGILGRILSR